ncbi:MAG: hypothetical protein PHX80_05215 [Candidatus Nanoarchaeia archaeon]|nr:hypothetical protein [Candidatus Nanoarchaeia archaeon]
MSKKNYTFSLDTDFIEQAKQVVENDDLLTYSSFNHFVEVAIRKEFLFFKRAGKKNNKITPTELDTKD